MFGKLSTLSSLIKTLCYRFFLSGVRFSVNTIIGPMSLISMSEGGLINTHGRVRFKDGARINVRGGRLSINGSFFANSHCSISCLERVSIGAGCVFGEGVRIYDHDHSFCSEKGWSSNRFITHPVDIGERVWLGANVVVLKGVTIGSDSVIAAGVIVAKDMPPGSVVISKQDLAISNLKESALYLSPTSGAV